MFTRYFQWLFITSASFVAINFFSSCKPNEELTDTSNTSGNSAGGDIMTSPGAGVTFNGHTYESIVLGNGQEWMAENLRTTIYANGDAIPNVTGDDQWYSLTSGAWCHYGNNNLNENPYGKLYNWYAVVDPRNVCPSGWHVPTDAEWTVLSDYLGGADVAGGKMKTTGTIEAATGVWSAPNGGATNSIGFSGVPGGGRYYYSIASMIGYGGYWWSSSEDGEYYAWSRYLSFNDGALTRPSNRNRKSGFSVRCLRN